MLNAVRRGPASIIRSIPIYLTCRPKTHPSLSRPSALTRGRNATAVLSRGFHTSLPQNDHANALAQQEDVENAEIEQEVATGHSQHGEITKFEELATRRLVNSVVIKNITEDMKLHTMTDVQRLTINETLKGIDVLAQARTGTGKTIAFLLPVLQNIIQKDPSLERHRRGGRSVNGTDIRAIIISPTRELAEQIAVEAEKLVKHTGIIVQRATGGSGKGFHVRKMRMEGCHILVGTPGRLVDILSDNYSNIKAPNLSALVLDEADRLLDQGFAPEIKRIQELLPMRQQVDRQTLLFSATMSKEVLNIVRRTMKPDFKFVRTVQEGEQPTHERVPQKLVTVAGFENNMPALLELVKREMSRESALPFKAIVYFSATAEANLAHAIFQNLRGTDEPSSLRNPLGPLKSLVINAKLTQEQRTRAADYFRRTSTGILFSSDVTARGMDFPNVTHIIQIGIPPQQESYVHRLGRTARGDKTGEGWLIVTDMEARETNYRLKNMPLVKDTSLETARIDMSQPAQLSEPVAATLKQTMKAARLVDGDFKKAAYMSSLGIYSFIRQKQSLVNAMNKRVKYAWGLEEPPAISRNLVEKLGFKGIEGVTIAEYTRSTNREDSPSRFGDSVGRGSGTRGTGSDTFRGRGGHGDRTASPGESRSRSSYGDGNGRASYGDRGAFSSRGGSGDRPTYGDRVVRAPNRDRDNGPTYGERGGFSTRGGARGRGRGGFGSGPSRTSYGEQHQVKAY